MHLVYKTRLLRLAMIELTKLAHAYFQIRIVKRHNYFYFFQLREECGSTSKNRELTTKKFKIQNSSNTYDIQYQSLFFKTLGGDRTALADREAGGSFPALLCLIEAIFL